MSKNEMSRTWFSRFTEAPASATRARGRWPRLLPLLAALSVISMAVGADSLKVSSFPDGAMVYIDGVYTGKTTPMSTSISTGDHAVTVQLPDGSGWAPQTTKVSITEGKNDLSITLLPEIAEGPPGPRGPVGPQGPQGPQGDVGPAGLQGETGPEGPQGLIGLTGAQGLRGETGPEGPRGIQGEKGDQGAQGLPGIRGETGPEGPQGLQGLIGLTGAQGLRGETGPQGEPGPAYTPRLALLFDLAALLGEPAFVSEFPADGLEVYSDSDDIVALTLSAGGQTLGDIIGLIGSDQISETYRFRIAFKSKDTRLDGSLFLGQSAVLAMQRRASSTYYSGIITAMGLAAYDGGDATYVVTVEPGLSLLKYGRDYSVFQGQDVVDIVTSLLGAQGLNNVYYGGLQGSYASSEFEMMYRESPFSFANRLMEREGIFYYFRHNSVEETFTLADGPSSYGDEGLSVGYHGHMVEPLNGAPFIARFSRGSRLTAQTVSVSGYNFKTPTTNLTRSASGSAGVGEKHFFDSQILAASDSATRAAIRLEGEQSQAEVHWGLSNEPGLRAGHVFALVDSSGAGFSGDYVVTQVQHCAFQSQDGGSYTYYNAFQAIPSTTVFRPARKTPVPQVAGVVTAVVTGPAGSGVYVDQYGRIKVQFHWDRTGTYDALSSAWLRVVLPPRVEDEEHKGIVKRYKAANGALVGEFGSYGSQNGSFISPSSLTTDPAGYVYVADAGNRRVQKLDPEGNHLLTFAGALSNPLDVAFHEARNEVYVLDTSAAHPFVKYLPRVGEEVVVSFIEGNPSRPIVLGMVINGTHMPPVPLPDSAR